MKPRACFLMIPFLLVLCSCAEPVPRPRGGIDSHSGVRPAPVQPTPAQADQHITDAAPATPAAAPVSLDGSEESSFQSAGDTLAIDDSNPAIARSFTEFRPSLHGFRFVNSFSGSPLPIALPATEQQLGLPDQFGLCGGMSAAAADYFLAGRPLPQESAPPLRGSSLYDFLYQRQITTLAPMGSWALKFIQWMDLPETGAEGTQVQTLAELPAMLDSLSRGEPVMLGLVLVARGEGSASQPRPWSNHQVLAYAAQRLPMDVVEISIYDPNYPQRDDVVIRIVQMPRPRFTRIVPGRSDTAIRGLFRMPYLSMNPPI